MYVYFCIVKADSLKVTSSEIAIQSCNLLPKRTNRLTSPLEFEKRGRNPSSSQNSLSRLQFGAQNSIKSGYDQEGIRSIVCPIPDSQPVTLSFPVNSRSFLSGLGMPPEFAAGKLHRCTSPYRLRRQR
ncbi:hypothetical protein LXL04_029583 [Taraxacum kok-saghyz]